MNTGEALAIALGGALGALGRAVLVRLCETRWAWAAPWPVLLVNVLGCFAIGALGAWLAAHASASPWLRPLLGVGLLGGFTTYSAFAQESLGLLRSGSAGAALLSIALHLLLGLGAAALGAAAVAR